MFAEQKNIDFVYNNTMDDALEVIGDPGRIRQVLSNLLTNALKFTPSGSVCLSVTSRKIDSQTNGNDVIEVRSVVEDTGIGIEQAVLDRLFKPFSQADSSTARLYGGTGLGLTISRQLAKLMHGSVDLQSESSVGTKAIFSLPLKVSSSRPMLRTLHTSPSTFGSRINPLRPSILRSRRIIRTFHSEQVPSNGFCVMSSLTMIEAKLPTPSVSVSVGKSVHRDKAGIHILVVEDNAINQKIALKTLRKLGYSATSVWNGQEALSYLLKPLPSQPRPSVILMDVQMPVMDGYEATRRLRSDKAYTEADTTAGAGTLRDIPIIALTASAIQGDREKCYAAGMDDYLPKPLERDRLEEIIEKWVSKDV